MELSLEQTFNQLDTALGLASALSENNDSSSISLEHVLMLDQLVEGAITQAHSSANFTTQASLENYELAMEALSFNIDKRWAIGGLIAALIAVILKFINIIRKRNLARAGGPNGTFPIGSSEALNAYRGEFRRYSNAIKNIQDEVEAYLAHPDRARHETGRDAGPTMSAVRDALIDLSVIYRPFYPEVKFTEPRNDAYYYHHHILTYLELEDIYSKIVAKYNDIPEVLFDFRFSDYIQDIKDMSKAFTKAYRDSEYSPVERIRRDLDPQCKAARSKEELANVFFRPEDDEEGNPLPNLFVTTVSNILSTVRDEVDDSYKLARSGVNREEYLAVSNATWLAERIGEITAKTVKADDDKVMNRLYSISGTVDLGKCLKELTDLQMESGILLKNMNSEFILNEKELQVLKSFKETLAKARIRTLNGGNVRVPGNTVVNQRLNNLPEAISQTESCLTSVLNISRAWYGLIGPSNRVEQSCRSILKVNAQLYSAWVQMANVLGLDVSKYKV